MTDSAYLTLGSATSRYLTLQSGTSRYLTQAAATDYYLTLNDPAPYANDVDLLLAEAAWYIDSHNANFYGPVPNAGTAGATLNAQIGSTASGAVQVVPSSGYVYLPGVASNYLSVPDAAALDVVADVDIRVLCALDDWTPSTANILLSKSGASGNFGYIVQVNGAGTLSLSWSPDGTSFTTATSTVAPTVSDGAALWVRAALDVDDGGVYKVYFYTSSDGSSWTQLGTTVTGGATTSIYANGTGLRLGHPGSGTSSLATGKFYRAIVKDGIDGTTVLDIDCADASTQSPLFTASTGQTVTINVSGADSNDPKWLAYEGTPYVYLPGTSGNTISVPDSAAVSVTGSVDVQVRVALDDWTPSANAGLVGKWSAAVGTSAYLLRVDTTGKLTLYWVDGGSAYVFATSTVATGITDGAEKWVRATMDAATGDVKFYTADDDGTGVPGTWTQLGTTVSGAGATSIQDTTGAVVVGANYATAGNAAGKFYRARIYNGYDGAGTLVLDADCSVITSGGATSFTEQSSNAATVTISRSTSGRKTTLVGGWAGGGSLWLLGSDDFLEVIDDPAIDFGASDSFTVLAVVRQWATPTSGGQILAKREASGAGWLLRNQTTSYTGTGLIADGANTASSSSPAGAAGLLSCRAFTVDRSAQANTGYLDGTAGTPVSTTAVGSTENAVVMRVGRGSGATLSYQDFEFIAAAIWRRTLTAGEIAGLNLYFQNRAYNG